MSNTLWDRCSWKKKKTWRKSQLRAHTLWGPWCPPFDSIMSKHSRWNLERISRLQNMVPEFWGRLSKGLILELLAILTFAKLSWMGLFKLAVWLEGEVGGYEELMLLLCRRMCPMFLTLRFCCRSCCALSMSVSFVLIAFASLRLKILHVLPRTVG